MTTPGDGDGTMQSQMLMDISKNVGTLVTDVAVIKSQMAQGEYEKRIHDLEMGQAAAVGGRDTQARVTSWLAAAAAVGAGIAGYLHH